MTSTDVVAIIGGATALIGSIGTILLGALSKRREMDAEDEKRLERYDTWYPQVRRYIARLRAQLADLDQETDDPPPLDSKEVTKK